MTWITGNVGRKQAPSISSVNARSKHLCDHHSRATTELVPHVIKTEIVAQKLGI